MKAKIDVRNPHTLETAMVDIREAYREAKNLNRMALARCLAIKLTDYQERIKREGPSSEAAKRHAALIERILG
jgi:hypothetical protein